MKVFEAVSGWFDLQDKFLQQQQKLKSQWSKFKENWNKIEKNSKLFGKKLVKHVTRR